MTKNKYNAVLFDLDGTLLDTANDLGAALNYLLKKNNLPPVGRADYRPVASDGSKGLIELGFGEHLIHFDFELLRTEFLQFYQDNIANETCLYPGIETLLNQLNAANIPWGVVTNKPINLTLELLPHFNCFSACKSIVGGDSLPLRKPHPAPILHACNEMNVDANNAIYVGDAPRDIEAGNAANMFTIIAEWGYIINKNDCQLWHANLIAKTPDMISEIIF